MFILFDSNIWISQVGLRSKYGAAIRFFARQHGATIAIPEVVQMEVEEKLAKTMIELGGTMAESHRQLLPLLGQLQEPSLPSEEDIRDSVLNIMPDFDVPSRLMPLNLEAAHSSMIKLMQKASPSKRKEQFRDGVIWAHCMELLPEGDVYLISDDTDFYENGKYEQGLAHDLILEVQKKSEKHTVVLMRTLRELLEEIQMPFDLNKEHFFDKVYETHHEDIDELLMSNGFISENGVDGDLIFFATERADRAYVTFDLGKTCHDSSPKGREKGRLEIKGVGFVDSQSKKPTDIQLTSIFLDYPDWEPGKTVRGSSFLTTRIGQSTQHTLRFPLNSSCDGDP